MKTIDITIITTSVQLDKHFHFQTTAASYAKEHTGPAIYKHLSERANTMKGVDFNATIFIGEQPPVTLTGDEVYEALADYELEAEEQFGAF